MAPAPSRIAWLDGLRGVAAVMVVASHYQHAFLPELPYPALLAANGEAGVMLFFLISGAVLTPAFIGAPPTRTMASRFLRLLLPAAAAILVTLVLRALLPGAVAAMTQHSSYLNQQGSLDLGPGLLLELSGTTMLLGHAANSMFGPLVPLLPKLRSAPIPPLWSLHVEIWGSLLVLLLVRARSLGRGPQAAALVLAAGLSLGNALFLFLVGHVAAARLGGSGQRWLAVLLLGLGTLLCQRHGAEWLRPWLGLLEDLGPLRAYSWFDWEQMLGAILLFLGLARLPLAQRLLAAPLPQWLGRLSFPIYLLHWGVMLTLGGWIFLAALPLGAGVAAGLAFAGGLGLTLALAVPFERWVDQGAITLARRLRRVTA